MKDTEQRALFDALERKIEAATATIIGGNKGIATILGGSKVPDHIAHLEAQQREIMMGLGNLERKLDERFVPQARTDAQNIELHNHLERIDNALKNRAPPSFVLPSPRIPMMVGMALGAAIFVAGLLIGYLLK